MNTDKTNSFLFVFIRVHSWPSIPGPPCRSPTSLPTFVTLVLPCPAVNAVEFQGVSKSYAIYESPGDRLKELLSLNRISRHRDFQALQDLTFEVKRGETFCIVGENGSGKSTMLQMVAGILHPSAGTVTVNGRVSALLELGRRL